ncbi:MAG TPA: conjugative transfer signal peptidase TraF [Xanthobacteraceae bacterium]|nr:conjugative transfer signal peptidase TraF [Xanthobacteraceae bacterium]
MANFPQIDSIFSPRTAQSAPRTFRPVLPLALGVLLATPILAFRLLGLRIAFTGSACPPGIYRATALRPGNTLTRGELVLVCLPETLARFALGRGYLARGAGCGDGIEPVGKRIGALAGDTVALAPEYVAVNGRRLPNSESRTQDSRRRNVPHIAFGTYQVADGEVWLFGEADARSWDSRYFGSVPTSAVRTELKPVITW